ncbi:MAG: serine/threonine protein kinase [Anaerolineales bacterium]|nr:serine/threonine protein kinase [Anaerolineales bacterium]
MKDPLIGQQLANFHVEGLLGQGGMATVYYGQDVKLQRPVAIKVIDKRYGNDTASTKRFVNEARMMAQWRHENIIQIYYADDEQGFSYYVMEYVDGQDLSTLMGMHAEENELMPVADVLHIGTAVANALDYAHNQGVVHRDIKPSNILLAKDGRVLLGDFGMALEVGDGSMGSIFGTPHYISPEQARWSADAVPQSDLYSLGVILYEMITGVTPFNDPSPASIALQHISEAPPLPRSINPEISIEVEAVLLKALKKNPQDRYQSGSKLMAALDEAFNSTGSSTILSLPPLPVGVPTIRRSISTEQIVKRRRIDDFPLTSAQKKKKNRWAYILFILLFLLGIGAWYWTNNYPASIAEISTATFTPPPPAQIDVPVLATQTLSTPLETATQESATPEPSQTTETAFPIPTIKYPDGNNFTLFWNETSLILLNRSRTRRSYSGFTFERLDEDGLPTDRFHGYDWFDANLKHLPSKTCLSIYAVEENKDFDYLRSSDCIYGILAIARPNFVKEQEKIFWSTKDGSTQFRVLWLNEEIVRCEIAAGICEVYIP